MADLYEMLAEALSQPSRGYQAAQEAFGAVKNIDEGFQTYKKRQEEERKRKLQQTPIADILGRMPTGIDESLGRLTPETMSVVEPLSKFMKEPKSSDFYTLPQMEAIKTKDQKKISDAFSGGNVPRNAFRDLLDLEKEDRIAKQFGVTSGLRRGTAFSSITRSALRDPQVIKNREAIRSADAVLRLGDMQSALGDEALGFLVPRALEEVGNLAQAERTAVRISPNLVNRAKSLFQRNIGPGTTLTERDRADLRQIMLAFREVSKYRLGETIDLYANQLSENFDIPYEVARSQFGDLSRLTEAPPDQIDSPIKPIKAKNAQGVVIESTDGGRTWRPVNGN